MATVTIERAQLVEELKKYLSERFFLTDDYRTLPIDESILDLGVESLDFIQVLEDIKEIYHIVIDDDDVLFENFETVNKIADFILQKVINL
ncbi:MAG: acyl carrier protein [Desulfobacteraceae bacterium]|nr:acyl carrier protein [Desulfobacteraceae bacterium]